MANSKTTDPTANLYGDSWLESAAIAAGYFFVDMFGVKHGTRPTSPDPAVLAIPVTQQQIDAEAAVVIAAEKVSALVSKLQEADTEDRGRPALNYNTGGYEYLFAKKRATPEVIDDLRGELKAAQQTEERARLRLSRIEAARKEAIFQWNLKAIQDTPLAKALAESQRRGGSREGQELSEQEAQALAKQSS